jgi:hypothetical protein
MSTQDPPGPKTPIPDLGRTIIRRTTPRLKAGLYPGGLNQRPADHNQDGIDLTTDSVNGIVPRKPDGTPGPQRHRR